MECYKVLYSKSGKREGSATFKSYDKALDCALTMSDEKGYLCVILKFNCEKGKWVKSSTIYPNE